MSTQNQTQLLVHNWNVAADPFYAMKARSAYGINAVAQLSPNEAIQAVMGDELAGLMINNGKLNAANPVQGALFAAWCYLRLRQRQPLVFPIAFGEVFHFADVAKGKMHIAGLEVLRGYGKSIDKPNELNDAWKVFKQELKKTENFAELAASFGISTQTAKQVLMTGILASMGVSYSLLTFASGESFYTHMFGEAPENVVFVDPNWTRCFDFNATAQDVAIVIDWLAGALMKGGVSPIEVFEAEDGFIISMDSFLFHVTTKDGVFETSRNLRFNNMLLASSLSGYANGRRIPGEDLSLVNSYGTFLYGLMMLGAGQLGAAVPELDQLVSKKLLVELPNSSDDEARAADGDRMMYDRYVTVTRFAPIDLPIGFARYRNAAGEVKAKALYNREVSLTGMGDVAKGAARSNVSLPAKDAIDRAALLAFNLVRMPRGQFIDGRRACVQAKHVPAELRTQFVVDVLKSQCGSEDPAAIANYCRDTFGLSARTDAELIELVSNHLIVGLSSKLAKLIKRTAMDAACVGEFAEGQGRGLKRYGQPEESQNNWLIEAVVSPHATFPAGMAVYWGEGPKVLVKHTQTVQPEVPQQITDLATAVECYYPGELEVNKGWFVYTMNKPVPLADREPVAEVPYTTDEGNFAHIIRNDVPSGYLMEIRWRMAKVNGSKTSLQIVVVTQTRESQIKGRNNVKCMLSRYSDSVINNGLNETLAARSVFFADTNKWLDLVMENADVAACTAIHNADAEGLRLIAEANSLVGSQDENLVWSPVLAITGAYQPLIDWFEVKFGRAVWFTHADASGEWTEIMRRMYIGAKGWSPVETHTVGYAIPSGATDVTVLADGPVSDDHNNVVVFYTLDGIEHFVQRAWSYAGTNETGPVWQPVKVELSSVRASVGTTPLMAGVARTVEQEDPAYAKRLATDGFKNVHKSAVFFAMANNKSIKAKGGSVLPMHMLGDDASAELLRTDEILDLVNNPDNAGQLLKVLAPHFKHVVFSICCGASGHFSVYLPAVLAQDANAEFRSTEGLSDLITTLFVLFIQGVSPETEDFRKVASRARGALKKLTESDALIKSAAFCRMSMQAKTQALPGIPVGEIWVRESARSNSVYALLNKVTK